VKIEISAEPAGKSRGALRLVAAAAAAMAFMLRR
jgi:hypothetical protein